LNQLRLKLNALSQRGLSMNPEMTTEIVWDRREILYKEVTKEDTGPIVSFGGIIELFYTTLSEKGDEWVQINYTPSIVTISTLGVNRVFRKLK
jgi:hypothetical protein